MNLVWYYKKAFGEKKIVRKIFEKNSKKLLTIIDIICYYKQSALRMIFEEKNTKEISNKANKKQ